MEEHINTNIPTIWSFGDCMFNSKITMSEADKKESNFIENILIIYYKLYVF